MSVCNGSNTLFRTSEKKIQYFFELNGSDVSYAISIGNSNVYDGLSIFTKEYVS